MKDSYRVILPEEITEAIIERARSRTRKKIASAKTIAVDITQYITTQLRFDCKDAKTIEYYKYTANHPTASIIDRALNFIGRRNKNEHGIICGYENYFINLLCYYSFQKDWHAVLSMLGKSEDDFIVKNPIHNPTGEDVTKGELPRYITIRRQIKELILKNEYDNAEKVFLETINSDTFIDEYNKAILTKEYTNVISIRNPGDPQIIELLLDGLSILQERPFNWHSMEFLVYICKYYHHTHSRDNIDHYSATLLANVRLHTKTSLLNRCIALLAVADWLAELYLWERCSRFYDAIIELAERFPINDDSRALFLIAAYNGKTLIHLQSRNTLTKARTYNKRAAHSYAALKTRGPWVYGMKIVFNLILIHRYETLGLLDDDHLTMIRDIRKECIEYGEYLHAIKFIGIELDYLKLHGKKEIAEELLLTVGGLIKEIDNPFYSMVLYHDYGGHCPFWELHDLHRDYYVALYRLAHQYKIYDYCLLAYLKSPEIFTDAPKDHLKILMEQVELLCTDRMPAERYFEAQRLIAKGYIGLGQSELAMPIYQRLIASDLWKTIYGDGEIEFLNEAAGIFIDSDSDTDMAVNLKLEALKISTASLQHCSTVFLHLDLVKIYCSIDRTIDAKQHYEIAVALMEKFGLINCQNRVTETSSLLKSYID